MGTPKCACSASTSYIHHTRENSIYGFHLAPQITLCFCYKTCQWHTCCIHLNTHVCIQANTHVHATIALVHLRNLKMSAHKKSRRVLRTQATSCPKTRGQLRSNFSVVDDLQEQPNQATPPHQALELQSHQRTNCQQRHRRCWCFLLWRLHSWSS